MEMIARMEERITRPVPGSPDRRDDAGPSKPGVKRPETNELLRRMKRVDPDAARKYRQRSGE